MSVRAVEPEVSRRELLLDDEVVAGRDENLGPYELVFEGPSGGMGTIFMAVKRGPSGFRKVVALKRIHPHLVKQRPFVDMFVDEARVASQLVHPFVCGVQDFGEWRGSYYLVMEYLLGESLRDVTRLARRRERPAQPAVLARIFADLAEGLHAAHELTDESGASLGLVHRDISPSNLFVLYDGSVRVTDFGIARMRGAIHETAQGAVRGKLNYMSPEQVHGEPLDHRSDVWSMGVTLWEALSGRSLFGGTNEGDTIMRIEQLEVPAPSSVSRGAPSCFDPIVARCLERDPDRRYASARELSDALDEVAGSFDAGARRVDVATWLAELCPSTREMKLEMVRAARAGKRESEPRSAIFARPKPRRDPSARKNAELPPTEPELPAQPAARSSAAAAADPPRRSFACVLKGALLGAILALALGQQLGSCTTGRYVAAIDSAPRPPMAGSEP